MSAAEYARIVDGAVVETRWFDRVPDPNPVKGLDWRPVVREEGKPVGYTVEAEVVYFRWAPPPAPDLVAYVADRRWQKEVGGCEWNGYPVSTDRDSQAKVIAERLAVMAGVRADPSGWKFSDGVFRMVSNEDFVALALAVRDHVQSAFTLEAMVLAAIANETITTSAEIDEAFS